MKQFDEPTFIYALTSRPEDARRFSGIFQSEWLNNKQYTEILEEIYNFTRKYGIPPTLKALHKILKDKDEEIYNLQHREVLNSIEKLDPEIPELIYTLDQARDVAIVRSLQSLTSDQNFLHLASELEGQPILSLIHRWFSQFSDITDEETLNIKEAINKLVKEVGFYHQSEKIPSGIDVLDKWTKGGLRTKNLGILLAPTGHGKSAVLMNIAFNVAISNDDKKVWFISNELTMAEQTERFLSRLTGKNLSFIQDDPVIAYEGLDSYWGHGLDDRLRLTTVNREVSTDDLEAMMMKWVNVAGWKPDVIVLDFMERMRPNGQGFRRDKEWQWLGAVASDLVRFSKRNNILVWSATQTNRAGLAAKEVTMDMGQSSIRHFQEAALVVSMHKTSIIGAVDEEDEEEKSFGLQFKLLKSRHGPGDQPAVILEVDLKRMRITNTEAKVIEVEREDDEPSVPSKKGKRNNSKRPDKTGV